MRVKVCGNRDTEVFRALLSSLVDYLGIIFVPTSPRYVDSRQLDVLQELYERRSGQKPELVGVFANPQADEVLSFEERGMFSAFQFHGDESPDFLAGIRQRLRGEVELWKSIPLSTGHVSSGLPHALLKSFSRVVTSFIFDSKTGGSGQKFDWKLLGEYREEVPFYIAGGIAPSDVEVLRESARLFPALRGIDINSRFEVSPGVKDLAAIENFLRELRS